MDPRAGVCQGVGTCGQRRGAGEQGAVELELQQSGDGCGLFDKEREAGLRYWVPLIDDGREPSRSTWHDTDPSIDGEVADEVEVWAGWDIHIRPEEVQGTGADLAWYGLRTATAHRPGDGRTDIADRGAWGNSDVVDCGGTYGLVEGIPGSHACGCGNAGGRSSWCVGERQGVRLSWRWCVRERGSVRRPWSGCVNQSRSIRRPGSGCVGQGWGVCRSWRWCVRECGSV